MAWTGKCPGCGEWNTLVETSATATGAGGPARKRSGVAAGRPVVGTSVGLEGLDLIDGVHAVVADDAPAMAAAIVRLLTDDLAAIELADAGRHLVEERYRWSAIGARLAEDLLRDVG